MDFVSNEEIDTMISLYRGLNGRQAEIIRKAFNELREYRKIGTLETLTERHCGIAVIKDKSLLMQAMYKLAKYEDLAKYRKEW